MIVIDPSKGGTDSGNVGNGLVEKDYTLLISEYIYDRLKNLGADVKIIRETDEIDWISFHDFKIFIRHFNMPTLILIFR